jgi:hypothetical protein
VAGLEEELALAKQAKVAIEELEVEVLRKAYLTARATQPTGSLTNARHNEVFALTNVFKPLDLSESFEEEYINDAKAAIDAWIRELEAAKP